MPYKKILNQLLIFMNLCQHTKDWAILFICPRDIVDLKILQSDWTREFHLISQKPDFPQYNINF